MVYQFHATLAVAGLLAAFVPAAFAGSRHSPPVPDAIVDLRSPAASELLGAQWRYADAAIVAGENPLPTKGMQTAAPDASVAATHDIAPRPGTSAFETVNWAMLSPTELESRRTAGKLAFGWYRLSITVPETLRGTDIRGNTLVLDITADDYSEIWVDGALTPVLGSSGAGLGSGWNTPNRVIIDTDAKSGTKHDIAIFVANGPLSAPPSNYIWIRQATLGVYRPGRLAESRPVTATVTRKSPSMDSVIAPDARVELLADGFSFTEGPVWIPRVSDNRYGGGGTGGYLLFSDPNQNVIHRYEPATGRVSIFRTASGYTGEGGANIGEYFQPGSNGLALDPQGRLTICEHGNRRITRLEPNGTLTILVDRDSGKRLNSPNDLVYRSDGALFFTDPPFGLPKAFDDARKELPYSGIYCVYNGELRLASSELKAPNGLAFSPDERYLYVDNWEESRKVILRFEVSPAGELSHPTTFFDMTSQRGEIALDGLKVDERGNLYVSGPGGIWVLSRDGEHLGTISPPELPANFAFGDADGRTLYMTARTGIYRVRLQNRGASTIR
ncbi:MAG: SMP-30/gluconolactonase/LRE family protein [Phycisphaeraceae bacterium]|nr:SMP-30/gluconolactonase/LRE family protein [Phycisphaeraceae bacterium]